MARTPSPRSVGRYSAVVRLLKIGLPLAAVATVGAIFLAGQTLRDATSILSAEELARLGAGLRLEEPRFAGRTEAGEPFVFTATSATPDGALTDRIGLEQPRGEVTLNDGREVTGRSLFGHLDRGEDRLVLTGEVVIATSDGYTFETQRLEIDLESQGAVAPHAVRGEGPDSEIEAGRMRLEQGADGRAPVTIFFEDRVRVIFIPEPSRGGEDGAEGLAAGAPQDP